MKEVEGALSELKKFPNPMPGFSRRMVISSLEYSNNRIIKEDADMHFRAQARADALLLTHKLLHRAVMRRSTDVRTQSLYFSVHTQADMSETSIVSPETVEVFQNVVDVAGNEPIHMEPEEIKTLDTGQVNTLSMSEFLSRPVRITAFEVTPGVLTGTVTYQVDLWDAFLSEPSVRAKLKNYAYLKGKMCVRITTSGSPFHYGKIMVSYQPFHLENETLNYYIGAASTTRPALLNYLSQSPDMYVMDISDNEPLDMKLPFISPQPMLRLYNESPLAIAAVDSFDDAVGFGGLYIESIQPILAASATPSNATIFVYAWMEEIELGCSTGTVTEITTESLTTYYDVRTQGRKKTRKAKMVQTDNDETKTGPVQKIATAVAAASVPLSAIPVLAPFTSAIGIASTAVAGIASVFGWSYPTMANEPDRVKNEPFQNGAQVIGHDTGKKMTLDPMQGLTVDPRVIGSDEDEMSIAFLTSVESYIDTITWDPSDQPLTTAIWLAPVVPNLTKRISLGGVPEEFLVQPTALGFTAQMFQYWRGDITFRFEIVCSAYHRGKLAFYYEPNISQNVLIDATLDLNKQYVKIVDIQETQDIEFTVNWAFPKAWATVMPRGLLGDLGDVGFLGDQLFEYANGYIAVVPFTNLQSPDSSQISVNVYISAPGMAFNQMVSSNLPVERPATQSLVTTYELNPSTATTEHISEMHFGEQPISLRSMCKRFSGYENINNWAVQDFGGDQIDYSNEIWPSPVPSYTTVNGTGVNHPLAYMRYAYLGFRGGIRHRIGFTGDINFSEAARIKAELQNPASLTTIRFRTIAFPERFYSDMIGTVEAVPNTQGGIEFETPMLTNNLFGLSFSDDPFPATNTNFESVLSRGFNIQIPTKSFTALGLYAIHDIASGEDFTFLRYQGAPAYLERNV